MSTATPKFGDISYEHADPQASAAPTNGASPEIDPNDPRLTSEVITDNPAADAYAIPPPLPDGKWRAKLRQVDVKDAKGQNQRFIASLASWMNPPQPFLCTNVESSVIDVKGEARFDGYKLTDYWVKTLPNRTGTSPVATILRKLGVNLATVQFKSGPGNFNQKELMDLFLEKLAGEPELVIETAWDASCQTCQERADKAGTRKPKPFLRGQHRFPTDRTGASISEVSCPECKSTVRAQARIIGYHDLHTDHR